MVQVIQLFFSLTALIAVHQQVSAFSRALSTPTLIAQPQATYHVAPRTKVSLQHSNENVTDDVTCYIVNDEEIVNEGEKPHVVCTSEPDDYAWFNGIDPKSMKETDGVLGGAVNCIQGESHTGKLEWECD